MERAESAARRARRIFMAASAPLRGPLLAYGFGFYAAFLAALVVGVVSRAPFLGAGIGLVAGGGVAMVVLRMLAKSDLRAAWELIHEHEAFEAAEFRRRFGRRKPRTWSGIRGEAKRNSDPMQRAAYMVMLGRTREADALIDAATPSTADDRLGAELARQQSALVAERAVERGVLQERLEEIDDPTQRRHREHCVGLHDAAVAAAAGSNPLPIIASAWRRGEVAEPHPRGWRPLGGQLFWLVVGPSFVGFFAGFLPGLVD